MFTEFTRPQTKSIVVFGCDNDPFSAGSFCNAAPLFAIQVCWVKNFFFFISVSPFQISKGVGAKMHEQVEFHIMPVQLGFGRAGQISLSLSGTQQHQIKKDSFNMLHTNFMFTKCKLKRGCSKYSLFCFIITRFILPR